MPSTEEHIIEEFFDPEGVKYLTVLNTPEQILCWRWHGLIPDELIESAFLQFVDRALHWPTRYFIGDMSELEGGWGRLQGKLERGVAEKLAPKRPKIAVVSGLNPDPLTEWSIQQVVLFSGGKTPVFKTFPEARAWLALAMKKTA